MICVFYGEDSFSIKEALSTVRLRVGNPELQDVNTLLLSGREATPGTLISMGSAVPFLAERRLVIVEGLLASFEGTQPGSRRGRESSEATRSGQGSSLGPWRGLAASLREIAPTTDLVFLEGALRRNNPLLRELAAVAEVREFPPLSRGELQRWIVRRASQQGARIAPEVARLLADLIGADLWAQSSEIEKLSLYCQGREIHVQDVESLVAPAREASIFSAVDSILERSGPTALRLIARLLDSSSTVSYVLAMLARQVRLVLLAQELTQQRVAASEVGARLGVASSFALQKTLEQARRSTPEEMRRLHSMLLETDVAIKTGTLEERMALEVLVAQVCHPEAQATPAPSTGL